MSINIWPWVLGFALFQEDVRGDLVDVRYQFEHRVIGKVLLGKFPLASVTGISLSQYSMTVAWYNLKCFKQYCEAQITLITQ